MYDSNSLKRKLMSAGFVYADSGAQVAIINTCSVTKSAIRKNKQIANKAKKENPRAKIILTGCWPKVYDVRVGDLGVDYVFRAGEEQKLVNKIKNFKTSNSKQVQNSKSEIKKICYTDNNNKNRSRYFIKIQDGCEQYCSYCVIPYARGKLKSRPEKEVIGEIKNAADAGFREIVLSGVHIGLYGKDKKVKSNNFSHKVSLTDLVAKIIKIKNLGRVRISSIEVTEVGDELMDLIRGTDKVCNHLHISLQSGCDKILKSMNRPYSAEYFARRIKKLRKAIPDIAVTTDVIVGFPGETDADIKKTYDFCKKIEFSKIHVFSFSAHEKTPASKMGGQISREKIIERSKKLRGLSEKLEKKYRDKFKGGEVEVVIEGKNKNGLIRGKSEYYFDIEFDEAYLGKYGNTEYSNKIIGKILKLPVI